MNKSFDDIFKNNEEEIEVLENDNINEEPPKKKFSFNIDLKNDKVLLIQLILIGVWFLLTVIIYFFGYNLFEPFIEL